MTRRLPPPLMVAAVRHLRSNGWMPDGRDGKGRMVLWDAETGILIVKTGADPLWGRVVLDVTCATVGQAVDHLVAAGVLPPELHSISHSYVPAVDNMGDRIEMSPDGELTFTDGMFEQAADGWEPLYRRVVAS